MLPDTPPSEKATLETCTAIHRWSETLYSFRTTRPSTYHFTPGQFARLGLSDASGMLWRAYSITSAATDDFLEYFVVDVPDGAFSSILRTLKPGDKIWLEKLANGFMTVDRFTDGDDLWMLATGTGLGPYISILQDSTVWGKFRHLILVHCVRHVGEFAYQDALCALRQDSRFASLPATLHLIQTVTRDTASGQQSGRLHGRITTLLENGLLEKTVGLAITAESSRIMMCGNPQMIDDTRKILHERGLRPVRRALPGQFITENYW